MEQKEELLKTAEESMKFIKKAIERDWLAYPLSSLPYPKEKMKDAIKYYIDSQGKELSEFGLALAKLKYMSLAEFIDDNEAALTNTVGKRMGGMKFEGNVRTIDLPENLKGTNYMKRFLEIGEKIRQEKSMLFRDMQLI